MESFCLPLDKEDAAPATSLVALVALPHVFSSTLCQGAATDSSCVPSAAASLQYAFPPPATGFVSSLQEDTSPAWAHRGKSRTNSDLTTSLHTRPAGPAGKGGEAQERVLPGNGAEPGNKNNFSLGRSRDFFAYAASQQTLIVSVRSTLVKPLGLSSTTLRFRAIPGGSPVLSRGDEFVLPLRFLQNVPPASCVVC
ncbi:hypothetical protein HPB47_008971 [Ixodes persulcatus]|uniref:Uncharacterized protein n=1 Tax=Ixodes persulcatus TaxID=34615 RepID=A0AC60P395_IXOPE|nr:hypothetical protein HPB47_008971 [Ixodes persulcatus]